MEEFVVLVSSLRLCCCFVNVSDRDFVRLGAAGDAIEQELRWLIERLKLAGFVGETERVGARYIDFMGGDIFSGLRLGVPKSM
jgi:hypothetical protein